MSKTNIDTQQEQDVVLDVDSYGVSDDHSFTDAYKAILDLRKFEIEHFWKRSTFFWSTLVLVFGGYVLVVKEVENHQRYSIVIALVAFVYTLIFSLSLRGSKFWQEWWELKCREYEKQMPIQLFRKDMTEAITADNASIWFVLRTKHWSVTKLTMIQSDLTAIVWLGIFVSDAYSLWDSGDFNLTLDGRWGPNWLVIGLIAFTMACIGYFMLLLQARKGFVSMATVEADPAIPVELDPRPDA